jgi:hypothetical protein
LENGDIFCGHLEYFMTIWYIVCSFGSFFSVLVHCVKKNLATLVLRMFGEAAGQVLFAPEVK